MHVALILLHGEEGVFRAAFWSLLLVPLGFAILTLLAWAHGVDRDPEARASSRPATMFVLLWLLGLASLAFGVLLAAGVVAYLAAHPQREPPDLTLPFVVFGPTVLLAAVLGFRLARRPPGKARAGPRAGSGRRP